MKRGILTRPSLFDLLGDGRITADYVVKLIAKTAKCNTLPQHASDWRLITSRVEEYCSEAAPWGLLAVFYLIFAHESSLQEFAFSTLQRTEEKIFFRQEWLPYLIRLTELHRVYYFDNANAEFRRYSDSLREAWLLQRVLPVSVAELADVKPISLIRTTEHALRGEVDM
jgi:hypothetical protein